MEKRYIKVEEVAVYMSLGKQTIYNWPEDVKRHHGGVRLGRIWRFDKEILDEVLAKQRPKNDSIASHASPVRS